MSNWSLAWLISALCMAVMYLCIRGMQVPRWIAATFSSVFFFAPLGLAMNSGNSVVYLFDFFIPLVLIAVLFGKANNRLRGFPWMAVWTSAGLLPVVTSFGYAYQATDFLLSGINFYRLSGAVALAVLVYRFVDDRHYGRMFVGLVAIAIILAATMTVQSLGIFSTNLYEMLWNETRFITISEYADMKFIVLGMFKGEQGIMWMFFLCFGLAYMNVSQNIYKNLAAFIFVVLCFLAIMATGSKTSIVACSIVALTAATVSRSVRVLASVAVLFFLSLAFWSYVQTSPDAERYVNSTLYEYIVSSGSEVETAEIRFGRWNEALENVVINPLTILGIYTRSVPEYNIAYFHNEYLSVLMLGGILGILLYLAFIFIVLRGLAFNVRSKFGLAGLLLLVGNLVQGFSVAHLQPGFLFLQSATLSLCIYRIGIRTPPPFNKSKTLTRSIRESAVVFDA